MILTYDPTICDLCGSDEHDILLNLSTGQSMSSDRNIVNYNIKKLFCKRCGLVRSGTFFEGNELRDYYLHNYSLGIHPEHYFPTPQGSISRSKLICDWIVSAIEEKHWPAATHCLEIGAGSGMLMREFIKRFPDTIFEGIELSINAASIAQKEGLSVYQDTLNSIDRHNYDIILSVGVIEHVSSPTEFLNEIHNHLRPGGLLILCQPSQDIPSHDLFFFDHLHHFGSKHLSEYARKCGFRELSIVIGHKWMPNFSLHLWQSTDQTRDFVWNGPPGFTCCLHTASNVIADINRLDKTLTALASKQRRIAVFGLGEVYCLARTYSTLDSFPIVCGIDDQPDKPEFSQFKFPVYVPEDCPSLDIQNVILTMNKIYYHQSHKRLEKFGLEVYTFLS